MILRSENLVKRYKSRTVANNVSVQVQQGEIVGLLGPNGAGKTTLINSIIGITEVQSGEINIFGKSMKLASMEIKKNIGVVPQNVAILNEFTAIENVTYFARLYGLKGKELKQSVQQALEFTNLWDRRKDYPKKYSGGMLRRLNIACSIVHKPKLIIMDEPTVGIDPQSRNHILESIKKLNEAGSTIIYTSHYMEEVEAICTRVAIMDNGRLIAEGSMEELSQYIQEDQLVEIVLSNPGFTIIEAVKNVYGVKECTLSDNNLALVLEKSCNISKIINSITTNNGNIVKINMEQATLEDVFLSLTGKKLRD